MCVCVFYLKPLGREYNILDVISMLQPMVAKMAEVERLYGI